LGFVWFESITLFSIVLFVRVGWKLFYWCAVILIVLGVVIFFNKFYFFLSIYIQKQILYLLKIFSLSLFRGSLKFSQKLLFVLDHGWFEKFGPGGFYVFFSKVSLEFYYACFLFLVSVFVFIFFIL
jgi:hypothetical protein